MSQKCIQEGCNNDVYTGKNKCVLHCEKSKYNLQDICLYNDFKKALIENIAQELNKYMSADIALPKDDLIEFFTDGIETIAEANREILIENIKSHTIVFNHIVFPDRKSRDSFDYVKVLQELGKLHFYNCKFYVKWMELEDRKCFFNECIFYDFWSLKNYKVLEKSAYAIYERCIFNKAVSPSVSHEEVLTLDASQFDNCQFSVLDLHDTIFNKPIFDNTRDEEREIKSLFIRNCTVTKKFILNNQIITSMCLGDTIFKNKIELKNNTIDNFSIENSNFKGLIDLYGTKFKKFVILKSIFDEFVGFENCKFGLSEESINKEYVALFKYATFLDFINFREAQFYSGLDMSNANLKEYPNFLGVDIDLNNTNRETFRIVKHSFDSVGNISEANKYFAFEMEKEMKEISFKEYPEKKIILGFNHIISNFGQSIVKPFLFILIWALLHCIVIEIMDKNNLVIIDGLNDFAQNILPLKRFLAEGKEFLSLFFLVGYVTLVYHFVVAIKRTTKR